MNTLMVSENIRLEHLKYTHAFQIFEAIDQNRRFLSPWLPFVQQTNSQEDTEAFIRSVISGRSAQKEDVFVILYKNNFAGLIGIKDTDQLNQKTEIGYWIIEPLTGKGIVIRSVKTMVDYIFSVMNMNRIQIKCGLGNNKSSAIPKKLGFHFEGTERQGEKHATRFIDLEVYSLLRYEWERQ